MNIRAICTDIDGTLLDKNRQLSPRTLSVFRRIGKDIPIILASSRMPSAMTHLQKELNALQHPLICYNGGFTIHYRGDNNLHVFNSHGISKDVAEQILTLTRETTIHVSLYQEDQWYAPTFDEWTEREQRITKVSPKITNIATIINQWDENSVGAHKLMCMGPETEIHNLEAALIKGLSDSIHIYRSRPTYLELAPKSVTKATGLELLLHHHYDMDMNEVMAFGDNYNDIELLKHVGLGIAVGNANAQVKQVADEITLNSIDDGVAVAVEKYLL